MKDQIMSDALILKMQEAVTSYLEPAPYVRRRPGATCLRESQVDLPSTYQAEGTIRSIKAERDDMFINDIIYFLDSEEHGTNVRKSA